MERERKHFTLPPNSLVDLSSISIYADFETTAVQDGETEEGAEEEEDEGGMRRNTRALLCGTHTRCVCVCTAQECVPPPLPPSSLLLVLSPAPLTHLAGDAKGSLAEHLGDEELRHAVNSRRLVARLAQDGEVVACIHLLREDESR